MRLIGGCAGLSVRLITGRRSKYVVALLLLVLAGGLASQAGQARTENDPVVRLPEGAESTQVLALADGFASADRSTTVTVIYREGGLTADDREAVEELRESLAADPVPGSEGTAPPRVGPGGEAAVLVTTFAGLDEQGLLDAVEALRDRVATLESGGLAVAVTGPAAFVADIAGVFAGINTTLLLGAGTLVLVLLVLIYRSPVFWIIPFLTVVLAEGTQRGVQSFLDGTGLTITGQAAGIASIITFGAATDYALLLVARYREELRQREDTHEAMGAALRSASPAILASGLTVVAALLTLLLAKVGSTQALGPLAAIGVAVAMLLSLTLLPVLLLMAGRRAFWPRIPRADGPPPEPERGLWGRLGRRVRSSPRPAWVGGAVVLAVLALGLVRLDLGLAPSRQFATEVGSVSGQRLLDRAGIQPSAPALQILVRDPDQAAEVRRALGELPAVAAVGEAEQGPPGVRLPVRLRSGAFSDAAVALVPDVRNLVTGVAGQDVLVGGQAAQAYDTREAAQRDNRVVVPVALAVVLIILVVLLRALLLPALLILTVVASFVAALGVGTLVSDVLLGYPGFGAAVPLIAFIFLVALGVDYNIFLTARARQEAERRGTAEGMARALAATGAVITSAGVVLAGTFSILTLIPFAALIQVGVVIAFGVLLDTLLVRSVVVPALVWDIGPTVWWPAREPGSTRDLRGPGAAETRAGTGSQARTRRR